MSKSTLFGSLAKDQDEHVYKHPANTYEKFIEMWWQQAGRKAASSKQETVKEAQAEWNRIKNSPVELERFFVECEEESTQSGQCDMEVPDYGFRIASSSAATSTVATYPLSPGLPSSSSGPVSPTPSRAEIPAASPHNMDIFDVLCPGVHFLTDDVRNNNSFMTCMRASEVFLFLKERKMKLFYPMPSKDHKGHFCTFLEMCNKKPEELPDPDRHLPSYDSDLGRCTYCPKFVFLSKTEKKRHFQVYHPKRTTSQQRNPRKKKATSRQVKRATTVRQLLDTTEPLNSPDISEDGGNSSDDSEAPHNEADHNPPQSPPIPYTSCPETADKGDNSTLCVVCELGEDENEEDEVLIECTQCCRWVHESCVLPNYHFLPQDNDFLCPKCHRRSTRQRAK